jgi:oxygen-independent coproporphyrinogen-3 oxidase
MLNNLRLKQGFCEKDFFNKTQCIFNDIKQPLNKAIDLGLLQIDKDFIRPTELGRRFLNNLQELFLPNLVE